MMPQILRGSRFLRALVLTTCVGSWLVWLYVVARVVINNVDVHTPFLDSVPSVSFSALGVYSFGFFILSLFVYLWLWGRFDGRPVLPPGRDDREP